MIGLKTCQLLTRLHFVHHVMKTGGSFQVEGTRLDLGAMLVLSTLNLVYEIQSHNCWKEITN